MVFIPGEGHSLEAERLGALLGDWRQGRGPLHRRLAGVLRSAIALGALPRGESLPPERAIAAGLQVSRATVVSALEALKSEGLLEARQGSGTWVRSGPARADLGNAQLVASLEEHAIVRDLEGAPHGLELTAAAVDCAPEVAEAVAELTRSDLAAALTGHGYSPQGLGRLRSAVAEHLRGLGLPTTPAQVLITSGATQAILLAGRLYLEPGGPTVVEAPTYAGAIDVLSALGAKLLPVAVDPSGARVDLLADLLAKALPHLVYLVPDFHNPAGMVLSERRRAEVARLAAEYHVPVVEDLVQRELWFDRPPPPPIAAYAPEAPILTVGSMSKVFWGGLRIGWVRGDEATIARLARMKAVTDFGTPILSQLVSATLLDRLEDVAAARRSALSERLEVMERELHRQLPDWRWQRPAGGLSLWVRLPEPRAQEMVRAAGQLGVAGVPGTTFAVGERAHTDHLRLPFVAEPAVITEGIRRLAAAWHSLDEQVARPAPAVVV